MNRKQEILIIDDTPENLQILGSMLENEGYEVRIFSDGLNGFQSAIEFPPDLILLDIMMPGIDGHDVCKHIKSSPSLSRVPVIFLSAVDIVEHKLNAFREGAVDFITKPFYEEEVSARVRTHLKLIHIDELLQEMEARKLTEKKLHDSEELFRAITEQSSEGIILTDFDGKIILANRAYSEISGHSRDELLQMKFSDTLFEKTELKLFPVDSEGHNAIRELLLKKKSGETYFSEITKNIINIGQQSLVLLTIRDITARKKERETNDMLMKSIDVMHESAYWMDPEFNIVYVNRAGMESLGYESFELLGRQFETINSSISQKNKSVIWKILKEKNFFFNEGFHLRKNGSSFPVEVNFYYYRFSGKEYCFCFATDITERKNAIETIREKETWFRAIFDNSRDAINISKRGIQVSANPAFLKLYGYKSVEEIVNLPILNHIAPSHHNQVADFVARRMRGEFVPDFFETRGLKCDDTEFDEEVNASTFDFNGEIYSVAIIRDISDRKRLESEAVSVVEEERMRLGQELHDGLGQQLTGIAYRLQIVENKIARGELLDLDTISYISELNNTAIDQVRLLARGLYLSIDDMESAGRNIEEMILIINKVFDVNCSFERKIMVNVIDRNISGSLYFISREAVNNAIKHGKAKNIKIFMESDDFGFKIIITDDGEQIEEVNSRMPGMGMKIMRQRADIIGANFEFYKNSDGGHSLVVEKKHHQ